MTRVAMWWERVDRLELISAVRALVPAGGCLVLEGDELSGRSQAATLAEAELIVAGYRVHRIACRTGPWTAFEALAEAWGRLRGIGPGFSLTAAAQVAGRPIPAIVDELARMLVDARTPTALLIEDLDRDGARDYSFRRVFHALAQRAQQPVIVTYEPAMGIWPYRSDVLHLRDFSRDDISACLARASALWSASSQQMDDALALVFDGSLASDATVRPATAYGRLQAWREATA